MLLVDFADCADVPVTVLNKKAGSHVSPMTAAAASLFLLAAAPNKHPGAAVGALLSTRAAEDAVDAVSNKNTTAPSLSLSPNDRGKEGLARVAVPVEAPAAAAALVAVSAPAAPVLFVARMAAAAVALRLNLLGNRLFRGIVTSRSNQGVDGSIGFLGGGVPMTANPGPSSAPAGSNLLRFDTPPPPQRRPVCSILLLVAAIHRAPHTLVGPGCCPDVLVVSPALGHAIPPEEEDGRRERRGG